MRVMLIMKGTESTEASKPPTPEALIAMHNFNEELEQAGVLRDLGGLTPTSRGARVRYNGTKRTVIDGPFTESKELIAGFSLLEVKDLAEAIEWAKRLPYHLMSQGDAEAEVEIRPLFDASDFDPPEGA